MTNVSLYNNRKSKGGNARKPQRQNRHTRKWKQLVSVVQLFIFISVSSLILLIISRQHLKNLLLVFASIIIKSEMSLISVFFLVCDKNSSVAWPECFEIHTLSHMLCTNPTCELHWVSLHSNSLCPIICSYFKLFFLLYCLHCSILFQIKGKINRNVCLWLLY